MKQPVYKYAIGFVDYDCDDWGEQGKHYTGGPYLALLEHNGDKWEEVDRWNTEGEELVQEIIWIENDLN